MNLAQKIKDTALAILPVNVVVLIVHFTLAPLQSSTLVTFLLSSLFVIAGLAIFVAGADLGIVPAGSLIGAALTRTKKLPIILAAIAASGFIVTIAEPNLRVQGDMVESVTGALSSKTLVLAVSGGIAFFLALSMLRILFRIPFRVIVIAFYGIALLLASRIDQTLVAITFDASGAATGPLTVPFYIAIGIGVANVRGGKEAEDDSFGTTGIAAIGPIFAMTIVAFFLSRDGASGPTATPSISSTMGALPTPWDILRAFPPTAKSVSVSLIPLIALFAFFQVTLIKLPPAQTRRVIFGVVYAWIGLIFFFVGANAGFIPAGTAIGSAIGGLEGNWILIPIGCVLGAIIVCAEPAMWVLTEQIEEVSSGNVRRPLVFATIAIGVAGGVSLAMWRVLAGFSVWYLIAPLISAAIILTLVTPKLFASIAFDSGSVATGPVSSAFILPLTVGASAASGGNPAGDAFGIIAMIAVFPIVSIQILGCLYASKARSIERSKSREGGSR